MRLTVLDSAESSTTPAPESPAPDRAPFPEMIWIPGGTYTMGSDVHYPEEAPAHPVTVDGFWMDETAVTNAEFRRFVEATGHVTSAERPANPDDYPGAKAEMLVPASVVFRRPAYRVDLSNHFEWWAYVPGANWQHPWGPESSIDGLDAHPVVHVNFDDAAAYCAWSGKELPTEAEWERAARGGFEGAEYAWGADFTPNGQHMANTWQGEFPMENRLTDGFEWTAPVRSFRQTATASMRWPATCGSGRWTFTRPGTASLGAAAVSPRTRAAASPRRASTPPCAASSSRAR